jgi:hypothetical protein
VEDRVFGNPVLSPNRVGLGVGRNDSDGLCAVSRPFIVFSTSGLPSGAQIVTAELVLTIERKTGAGPTGTVPVKDDQTYFRAVRAQPADPAVTATDFGLISTNDVSSDKHFFLDILEGQDLVIPLTSKAFPVLTSGTIFTLALLS